MYDYILKRKLERIYKNSTREKRFLNWKEIQTVLVLFDTSHIEEVTIFIQQLKQLKKKVTVYAYQKKSDKRNYLTTGYHIILEKEAAKWFNNPLHNIVNEQKEKPVDAVIDLTIYPNIPLEYILASIPACVKAGLKKTDAPQYDLALTTSLVGEAESCQVRELSKQIVYYLDRIGSAPPDDEPLSN